MLLIECYMLLAYAVSMVGLALATVGFLQAILRPADEIHLPRRSPRRSSPRRPTPESLRQSTSDSSDSPDVPEIQAQADAVCNRKGCRRCRQAHVAHAAHAAPTPDS